MEQVLKSIAFCSTCQEPLNSKSECVACLLRGGLEESLSENGSEHDSLVFGDFEIARREDGSLWELGWGAMGVTYRAVDKMLHRTVALKVIETPSTEDRAHTVRERFLREARSAAALRHPNVAGIFQFGASPQINRCYYAMELVEGETLEARVRRDGPLKVEAALEMAIQVARALVAAAAQGLIHRDLKPGNIMLTHSENQAYGLEVKVIDFGLAKTANAVGQMDLTHGAFVGTPTFASPEQFSRRPVDARSDIYSLGVTLWYALTGDVPYPGKTIEEIRDRQTSVDLPIKQLTVRKIPDPVIQLLRFTLAVDPLERPASARELTESLESCRRKLTHISPNESVTVRNRRRLIAVALIAAITAGTFVTFSLIKRKPISFADKSIAVLPFDNLSEEKEHAFFADGIQDDILTSLAKISDLKVISRTSSAQYRGTGVGRNLREIARELGVGNILEGSVRRAGDHILVNVQLIDARNDQHIWAEHYDRTLADSIGLQSEVAGAIAGALRANLATQEKARLEVKPTNNSEAYVLYLRARDRAEAVNATIEDKIEAEQVYEQAIALDPGFALARARASIVNSWISGSTGDRGRKSKARAQAEEALRLSPTLGEAHLALGLCLYWAEKDYPAALKEFSIATATSPSDPEALHYIAGIYRRQGRWRESLASEQRALDLDPRNLEVVLRAAIDYLLVRDWAAVTACYNRALEIAPDSATAMIGLAYLEVFRNSNPAAGRKILEKIPASLDPDGAVTGARWDLAMLERDYATAEKILADFHGEDFPSPESGPKSFYQGRLALARGDKEAAQRLFSAAAPGLESWMRDHQDDPNSHVYLARVYAYLGRKEDAIREGRQAVAMEPESQNAFHGAVRASDLALVYAATGETDQAITLIERLLTTPGPVQNPNDYFAESITLADLRLRWEWDSLRSDPRYQKILSEPEPKTIY